ncbi:MAG TPA: sialidase family protein [Egibacteraceae bacterium]|nr:sialidase family protein [Egibacteraceae bacterium]
MMRATAAVLCVLGVGAVLFGLGDRPAQLRGQVNDFVNIDRPGLNAHNSPAVAAHPSRPEVVALADRIDTPRFSCSLALSSTGGVTWQPVALPLAAAAPNCFWPDVAFTGDGDLLVLYTATGGRFNLPVGVWLQRLEVRDGAATAGPPVRVAGPLAFHARLATDGPRVFVAWVQAGPATADKPLGFAPAPNPILLARSADAGATFARPVQVSEDERLVAQPTVLVGPGGQVLVGALDLGDDVLDYEARHQGRGGPPDDGRWRIAAWSSSDGGATFGDAAVVADDLVIPARIVVDLAPAPGFARDTASGRIYATWDAGRGDDRDVFLAWSDDAGVTWSAPTRVAPRPRGQLLPTLGVSPDGRIDVLFYDRTNDPADVMTEVTLASSWDDGQSFATATVSDRPFDSGIGLGSLQGMPTLGSQLAVLSRPRQALAFWADTRQGTVSTNVQDLAVAMVDVRPPADARPWVVGLGATLVACAAGLLAVSARPRSGDRTASSSSPPPAALAALAPALSHPGSRRRPPNAPRPRPGPAR